MGGDRVPGPFDEEHVIDTLIADLKAVHKAIPELLLVLASMKARKKREAATA